jgi:FkbM family methyltransferase
VGAFIGVFSVLAASQGASVYAYEPTPHSFEFLQQNISAHPTIQAHNLAVAGTSGSVTIYTADGGDEGNSLVADPSVSTNHSFTASATTLADIFSQNHLERCTFLKMDCEGGEMEIFQNTPKEIFARIDNIAMEYHRNLPELTSFLTRNHFLILGTSGGEYGYLYARRKDSR